jgi:hypothetical protein
MKKIVLMLAALFKIQDFVVPLASPKVLLLGNTQINLVFHSLIRTFAPDGYTEFLHIASERGL